MMTKMKTKVFNDTTHSACYLELGGGGVPRLVLQIRSKEASDLKFDPNATYRLNEFKVGDRHIPVSIDDYVDATEITIYETLEQGIEWRISKARGEKQLYPSDKVLELASFDALRKDVRKDAPSRIEMIETSCASLKDLLKRVKICPAQCKNLVQTCLEGTEKLKRTYIFVAKNDYNMWQLYYSKKLRQLISSLDRLLSTLESIEDLLQACGSQWCRMGLVQSAIPLPPPGKKTFTKFDLLLKEVSWDLDTIYYVLDLTKDVKLNWTSAECVIERNHGIRVAAAGVTESVEPAGALVQEDHAHFLANLEDGSLLSEENFVEDGSTLNQENFVEDGSTPSQENFVLQWALNFILSCARGRLRDLFVAVGLTEHLPANGFRENLPTDGLRENLPADEFRDYFAEVLKGRLQEKTLASSESNKFSAIPGCFRIDHEHLNFKKRIAGDCAFGLKAIYRGDWRGQEVAIGITKNPELGIEDVEVEAAVMLKVQHPNIVGFLGYAFTDEAPPPVSCKGDDEPVSAGYLVMELMQGDLRQEINRLVLDHRGSPFPDAVTVDILLQIAEAMIHMHDCGVLYRDLKAANCVVNQRSSSKSSSQVLKFYTVKLIDFGTSKEVNPDDAISNHTMMRGTTRWMAPEVWGIGVFVPGAPGQKTTYNSSVDVYSFGMTCYEVVTGSDPFPECKKNAELQLALREGKRPLLPASVSCPEGLKQLMSKCWAQNPSERPDFRMIEKELWTIKCELELQ